MWLHTSSISDSMVYMSMFLVLDHDDIKDVILFITLFCDIEGFEKILLDPIKVPNLKYVDLLIEAHDCFVPNITEELIERFYLTHTIRIIVDYPYRIKNYKTPKFASKEQVEYIINEKRSSHMKFIYMESVNEKV